MSEIYGLRRLFLALVVFLFIPPSAIAQSTLLQKSPDPEAIREVLNEQKGVRIIIEFAPLTNLGKVGLDQGAIQQERDHVRSTQDLIISRHFGDPSDLRTLGSPARSLKRGVISPILAVNVSEAELEGLANDPLVLRIHLDRPEPPNLTNTVSLIHMTHPNGGAYALGATGVGQAVAIIDTGVQAGHPFITASKVAAEACFSTTNSLNASTSMCRNGVPMDSGPGAGANCDGIDGCEHGTHVAGIAAGKASSNLLPNNPPHGIAKEAKIISIMAFSRFNSPFTGCPNPAQTPCVLSYISDQKFALDWIFLNSGLFGVKIAAVNMSLGGGLYPDYCDSDVRKSSIDQLRTIGIATIVATGNNGSTSSISAPACISTAIRVGASTKDDHVSEFSNVSSNTHLLAPGGSLTGENEDIFSSVPTNAFAYIAGTSQAAPHVAGAFAAIRSVRPNASIDQIRDALIATGHFIFDQRSGGNLTKPRIRVDMAVKAMTIGPPPAVKLSELHKVKSRSRAFPTDVTSREIGATRTSQTMLEYEEGRSIATGFVCDPPNCHTQREPVRWVNGQPEKLSDFSGWRDAYPAGISADGSTIVGWLSKNSRTDSRSKAFVWQEASGKLTILPHLPGGNFSLARAVDATGSTIVGHSGEHGVASVPVVWKMTGGLQRLSPLPGFSSSGASAISSNGDVVVGASSMKSGLQPTYRATRWRSPYWKPEDLGALEGANIGCVPTAANVDGSVVVGNCHYDSPGKAHANHAFLWSAQSSNMIDLGTLGPSPDAGADAVDVSDDGTVVVGKSHGLVYRWLSATGMQSVRSLLLKGGVKLEGIQLTTLSALSRDGTLVTGTGAKLGTHLSWIAQLPLPNTQSISTETNAQAR